MDLASVAIIAVVIRTMLVLWYTIEKLSESQIASIA